MALSSKRHTAKLATEVEAIVPIAEVEAYRVITEKIEVLSRQRAEKAAELDELHSQRRKLSSQTLVDRLTTKYLSGASQTDESSYNEKIALISEEIKALEKAIQVVQRERDKVRTELSVEMLKSQSLAYRSHVRQVLTGMILMQLGNQAILALRETLDLSGYASSSLVPTGLCPWPYWGAPQDGSSRWRSILTEMLNHGHIDADEFEAISSGDFSAFTA